MKKYKPDIVFSKGGFVSVPVVLAAKHAKIPTIIHESDITPGLANRIAIRRPAESAVTSRKRSRIFRKQSGIVGFPDSRRIAAW